MRFYTPILKLSEGKTKKTILFIVVLKNKQYLGIIYLGINLTKEVMKNYKTLKKEIEEI